MCNFYYVFGKRLICKFVGVAPKLTCMDFIDCMHDNKKEKHILMLGSKVRK